jgi:hypothetical protein
MRSAQNQVAREVVEHDETAAQWGGRPSRRGTVAGEAPAATERSSWRAVGVAVAG